MNIVDATLILRKGKGGTGRNTKEKLGQVFTYYGMAWSM
jgi:hypothetical protein